MNREMDAAFNVVEESFFRHWFFNDDAFSKRGGGGRLGYCDDDNCHAGKQT